MNSKLLSLAIAFIVVFCIGLAYADHAKWNKGPCVSNNTITGMATGLGDGPYALHVTGYYDCVNKGNQTPNSANWSNLDVVIPINPKTTGGNFKISAVIPSQCDHANWTFITKDLKVTLIQNERTVIGATAVNPCN